MREFDLIFIGAGLVNSLSFYLLSKMHPERRFLLIEQGPAIGGQHTWSFHAHDVSAASEYYGFEPSEIFQALQPLITAQWADYEVRFEGRRQVIALGYCCMRSHTVHDAIMNSFSSGVMLNCQAEIIDATTVSVEGLGELRARSVIDGRGHSGGFLGPLAFQKFHGIFVHDVDEKLSTRPILMDATVEQDGDFRFIYVLPFGQGRLLVEDTRFSSNSAQDHAKSRDFIQAWLSSNGVRQFEIEDEEHGCLPIPLLGMRQPIHGAAWPVVGYRAGLFNASTGYSFSYALRTALWLADEACYMTASQIRAGCIKMAASVWSLNEFNRRLNNMMVGAIAPERRREIFSRFYSQLPASVIARFYSGDLSVSDKLRILNIRPKISWSRAFKSFVLPTSSASPQKSDSTKGHQ